MRQLCVTPASTGHFAPRPGPPPQKQLRAMRQLCAAPPVSRPVIPLRYSREVPPRRQRHPRSFARRRATLFEASPNAPTSRRRSTSSVPQLWPLRARSAAASFGRPGPGQPPPLQAARQTPTSAAGHERVRAKFSPRTPANTRRPKLPPRKSPRPSPPCALMSADRRTWPQRRLARGRLEKSNGCKPATPDPPIAAPAVQRGTRSFASPPHPPYRRSAAPPHRRTAAPQHRSCRRTAVSSFPPHRRTAP